MYGQLASVYDIVYAYKDYEEEARLLHRVIEAKRRSRGKELLDVGCGTGKHLEHLARWYRCEGLDLSPQMLAAARRRLPNARFHLGSMEDFEVPGRFDAIVCLFGALGYTLTVPRMAHAVRTMARHLRPGGVLVVAPWLAPRQWLGRAVRAQSGEAPGTSVARVTVSRTPRPRQSRLEMHYLIGTTEGVRYVVDVQDLGLFRDGEIANAFRSAGLRHERVPTFRGSANGLHLGVRPVRTEAPPPPGVSKMARRGSHPRAAS